jgi:hypothetical protein
MASRALKRWVGASPALCAAALLLGLAAPSSAEKADSGPCLDESPPGLPAPTFHLVPEGWTPSEEPPAPAQAVKPQKRFWLAAGEIVALNVGMWAVDRYVIKAPWAYISVDTWKTNLRKGFHWDDDDLPTNQAEHPFNGSFYFAAARSNGFTFWESSLFAAAGSLMWEYFGENQLPSTNDIVNTTLGGTTQGEIFHRVSTMILDNMASGSPRFFRELGAFLVDPIRGANRLIHGDMSRDSPNPEDRFPVSFLIELDLGYQQLDYDNPNIVPYPHQSLISVLVRYGDPFLGANREPFDYFEALVELGPPSGNVVARRWLERGQLVSWGLSSSDPGDRRFGLFMNYEYINNQVEVFSAQNFSANVLARFPLGQGLDVRGEAAGVFYPIIAIDSDYPDANRAVTGRVYDYGLGGGLSALARLQRDSLDLFLLSYNVVWSSTKNGLSVRSTIQSFNAEGRYPLARGFAVGAGYGISKRITSYVGLPTVRVESPQWKVFGALTLR